MTSPYKKIIPLKQHTPLIHFQYDQAGATLRATEVKPKLDRFIREELEQCNKALYNRFVDVINDENFPNREEDKSMSSYKMRIRGTKTAEYVIASYVSKRQRQEFKDDDILYISNAPYFANNEQIKKNAWNDPLLKKGIISTNIELELFSFESRILELLEQALPYFFAYNNFGTRQSKGFGSFSVDQSIGDFEDCLSAHPNHNKNTLKLQVNLSRHNPHQDLFKAIDAEYKVLKSGVRGEDSQMMLYFEGKGIDWEKWKVKEDLVNARYAPNEKNYSHKDNVKYVRALLGLAELYEFPQKRKKVSIECLDKDIQRFKSPITFKVFEDHIYMLTHDIPEKLFNKTFKFSTNQGSILINTPTSLNDFDLNQFLEDSVDKSWKYVNE